MRHIGGKAYAGIAAPWASSALLAALLSTGSYVGVVRPALCLPRASDQLLGPSSGRNRLGCGCGRPTSRPSRIEPRFSPPTPPNAAILATTSVVVMVGDVCPLSGGQTASFSTDIDLWRSSQKRYQRACERGSAEAMRAGQVCRESVLKVAEPSSKLRRAMGRRLTGADDGKIHPQAPRSLSRPSG